MIREYITLDGQPIALIREQQGAAVTLLQNVNLNHIAQTVDLGQHATAPVIFASPLTYNGGHGAVVGLDSITSTQASIQVKEWDYLDGGHAWEDLSLLALPPGRYPQADGSIWEVGRFTLSGTRQWHTISFNEAFEGEPYLFLTQQSQNALEATSIRARNIDTTGFQAFLQEQESLNDGHGVETIGYLAIYSPNQGGTATFYGASFNYQLSQLSLNHAWTAQGDQELKIQEEASRDSELGHTTETLDILQIEGHLFAQDVTTNGWDTMALRRRGPISTVLLSGNPTEQGVVYLHTDHLGAVIKATDGDQNIVWDAVQKPFGERIVTTAQIEMPLGFPGQYYDEESGDYYNYFRDYDPGTGRYLQSDPIGLKGGLNTYAYVYQNPMIWIDRFGLFGDGRSYGPEHNPQGHWGHSDFTDSNRFDYTREDHDPRSQPLPTWDNPTFDPSSHFRPRDKSLIEDLGEAIDNCDKDMFERYMHQLQDTYSHYDAGYRWPWTLGHAFGGQWPDRNGRAWQDAERDTKYWVEEWDKNCPCVK